MNAPVAVTAEHLYKAVRAVKQSKWIKSLPVLTHVHLYTCAGRLRAETTNLDTPLKADAAARIDGSMDTCVPYKPFLDWLRISAKCKDVLELVYNPQIATLSVSIRNQRSRAQFKCITAQEFPPLHWAD